MEQVSFICFHMHSSLQLIRMCAKASWADTFRTDMTKRILYFCWRKLFLLGPYFISSSREDIVGQKYALDMGYTNPLVPIGHVRIGMDCSWPFAFFIFLTSSYSSPFTKLAVLRAVAQGLLPQRYLHVSTSLYYYTITNVSPFLVGLKNYSSFFIAHYWL